MCMDPGLNDHALKNAPPVFAFQVAPVGSTQVSLGYTSHWFAPVVHSTRGGDETAARTSVWSADAPVTQLTVHLLPANSVPVTSPTLSCSTQITTFSFSMRGSQVENLLTLSDFVPCSALHVNKHLEYHKIYRPNIKKHVS
jgi:hypothetical protein